MITLAAVTVGLATVVIVITIGLVALLAWALRAADEEPGPEGPDTDAGSDGGGGGSDRDRPGPTRDSGGDPVWWPEFERELTRYVARQGRDRAEASSAAHR